MPSTRESRTRSRHIALLAFRQVEHAAHDAGDLLPILGFFVELPATRRGDGVELCLAIVVGDTPTRLDPAALLEPEQRGVDGALVHLEEIAADLFEPPGDPEAVQRPEDIEGFEDHEIERSLEYLGHC